MPDLPLKFVDYPGSYELNTAVVSESGSSETGHCSNVSDSSRLCNAPRSSVLFDGIPTLTGLEGDMWASQLLTLNTSISSASITFDFTNPTDRNGPTFYTGVEVIEVVIFNCPARGIGTNNVQFIANGNLFGDIAVSDESCDYLVRGCNIDISSSSQQITLSFSKRYARLYIAEITFNSSTTRPCSSVGPLTTASVISSTEQISTSPSNKESSSDKQTQFSTLASDTSEITFFSASVQDEKTNSSLILPPTSECVPTPTEYMPTTSIQGSHFKCRIIKI